LYHLGYKGVENDNIDILCRKKAMVQGTQKPRFSEKMESGVFLFRGSFKSVWIRHAVEIAGESTKSTMEVPRIVPEVG